MKNVSWCPTPASQRSGANSYGANLPEIKKKKKANNQTIKIKHHGFYEIIKTQMWKGP